MSYPRPPDHTCPACGSQLDSARCGRCGTSLDEAYQHDALRAACSYLATRVLPAASAAVTAARAAGLTDATHTVHVTRAADAAKLAADAARAARGAADLARAAKLAAGAARAAGAAAGAAADAAGAFGATGIVGLLAARAADLAARAGGTVGAADLTAELNADAMRAAADAAVRALHQTERIFSTLARDQAESHTAVGATRPPGVLLRRLLAAGCALLPAGDRSRFAEEWLSLLTELPTRRARARHVLSLLYGAPRQAHTLRHRPKPVPPA